MRPLGLVRFGSLVNGFVLMVLASEFWKLGTYWSDSELRKSQLFIYVWDVRLTLKPRTLVKALIRGKQTHFASHCPANAPASPTPVLHVKGKYVRKNDILFPSFFFVDLFFVCLFSLFYCLFVFTLSFNISLTCSSPSARLNIRSLLNWTKWPFKLLPSFQIPHSVLFNK